MRYAIKYSVAIIFCLAAFRAAAQPSGSRYDEPPLRETVPETDWDIVQGSARGGVSLFRDLTLYETSFVRYRRRGAEQESFRINGADCFARLSPYMHYSIAGALRPLGREVSADDDSRSLELRAEAAPRGHSLSLRASESRYRFGARVMSSGALGSWNCALLLDGRTGRDAHIGGLFTRSLSAALLAGHSGRRCDVEIVAAAAPEAAGLHSAAVAETFGLTGDVHYNPSWGYSNGRMRSARVSRSFMPHISACFSFGPGKERFRAVLAATAGERSLSGLAWYGAMNPLPDYWRLLPSWLSGSAAEMVEELWRRRDPATVQIDWEELARVNAMAGGEAAYIVEERVERPAVVSARFSGSSRLSRNVRAEYGAELHAESNRLFKRAADLLGASGFADVDSYLVDDEYFGDSYLNDTDHPDRTVRQGERFGYDCRFVSFEAAAEGAVRYESQRFGAAVSGRLAASTLQRRGFYRKESLPDSFGASELLRFTPYRLRAEAVWHPDMHHSLSLVLRADGRAPHYEDIFLTPACSNATAAAPQPDRTLGAELSYVWTGSAARIEATAYMVQESPAVRTSRYYDDLASLYSDLVLTGLQTRRWGAEAAAEVPLSSSLTLSAAVAAGSWRYVSDPAVRIVADADHREVVSGERAYLRGLSLPLPQRLGMLRAEWSRRGWRASLSAVCLAGRHAETAPARRMHRIADLASSPETFARFTEQEKIPAAWNVRLFVSRSFTLRRLRLILSAAADNLLDAQNIYTAYEQSRVAVHGTALERSYEPFPSRYRYGRPRSFLVSLTFKL